MTKITVDKDLIEQAIEALEDCRDGCEESHKTVSAVAALRSALAEPALEPIPLAATCHCACVVQGGRVVDYCKMHGSQLIASPPPAEVPLLTDDEVAAAVIKADPDTSVDLDRVCRAIEQAVRQKAGIK